MSDPNQNFFELTATDGAARAGIMHTAHGDILTPAFMPVGTQATVKTLDARDVHAAGARVMLANTYHLHLRPGEDTIAALGGLHAFMHFAGAILTDSGGFQVFSLGAQKEERARADKNKHEGVDDTASASRVKIDDDGVSFRSHLDGSLHRFTPERAIEIQQKLGADIIMAFDVCTPDAATETEARAAMELTHAWAARCIAAHEKNNRHDATITPNQIAQNAPAHWTQFLFGIIQGANHRALREESAQFMAEQNFDGIAIGGESIGYNMAATATTLEWLANFLPTEKPRYTMGVGYSPRDIFAVVSRGVDMFDCVAPTRVARNGTLYCRAEKNLKLNMRNAAHERDPRPIDAWCDCFTCQNHSRAYLHHLFRAEEMLAYRLASIHNVRFMLKLCGEIRAAIVAGAFQKYAAEWI